MPGSSTNYASSFPENAGIRAALLGTLWLMGVCAAFIIPVGVASAVYLEEYADRDSWYNRFIEVNIQNLAAVPSIIYGILGLAFLVRGPIGIGRVVLAGGLTLALLVLPVVIIAAREAIRAVPPSIREGSMALGATKWQTIWKQVLPAAIPGHRDRSDPGLIAGDRRDRAADPGRRRRPSSPSIPTAWTRRSRFFRCRPSTGSTSPSPSSRTWRRRRSSS